MCVGAVVLRCHIVNIRKTGALKNYAERRVGRGAQALEARVAKYIAESLNSNWSAHGHIHTKISNRRDPATTEKLVYVYSNSKLVASIRDANKLKMFAWDNEDV